MWILMQFQVWLVEIWCLEMEVLKPGIELMNIADFSHQFQAYLGRCDGHTWQECYFNKDGVATDFQRVFIHI